MNRITPENIQSLEDNEIFVFGSNKSGIHGAGAAKLAYNKFGAKYGLGFGLSGNTYAIPTKDYNVKDVLPIDEIQKFVNSFYDLSKYRTDLVFYVTEIGCGYAGYKHKDISPLFKDFLELENVYLPENFTKEIWKK